MLLLKKKYKLGDHFVSGGPTTKEQRLFAKNFNTDPTIHNKGYGLTSDLSIKIDYLIQFLAINTKISTNFLGFNSYIWNILLQGLKITSFLSAEKSIRNFNLHTDDVDLRVKDFITFIFKKNYGFVLFNMFNKYNLRQKLLVEFLTLNNYTTTDFFDTVNYNKNKFRGAVNARYLKNFLKVLLPWQNKALDELYLQNFSWHRMQKKLNRFTVIEKAKEFLVVNNEADDVFDDDNTLNYAEDDSLTYFFSGDFFDITEKYGRNHGTFLSEVHEEELISWNLDYKKLQQNYWTEIPRFSLTDRNPLYEPKFFAYPFSKNFKFSDDFLFYVKYDLADFGAKNVNSLYGIEIIQKDYSDLQSSELINPKKPRTEFDFWSFPFPWGLSENYGLNSLILFDQNNFVFPTEFVTFWTWKDLLTSNFFSFNFNEVIGQKSLKLTNFNLYFYQLATSYKEDFQLCNKNFYYTLQDYEKKKKKYFKQDFFFNPVKLFDLIPLTFFEQSILKDQTDFELLFGLSTTPKQNTFGFDDNNLSYINFTDTNNTLMQDLDSRLSIDPVVEIPYVQSFVHESNNFFLMNYSNFRDTHPLTKQIDRKNFKVPEINLAWLSILDDLTQLHERNFNSLESNTLLVKNTWFNWSISFFEMVENKFFFFCHPFFNQFHQILYRLFFKKLLINFLTVHSQEVLFNSFWMNQTTYQLQNLIKKKVILEIFLEKIDFSEDFLKSRVTRLNLFDLKELQYTYPLFFIEKQLMSQNGYNNLIVNSRKFWENNVDLYDWHFLQFSDARWQDFVTFLAMPTNLSLIKKKYFGDLAVNFWPLSLLVNRPFYSLDRIDYKWLKLNDTIPNRKTRRHDFMSEYYRLKSDYKKHVNRTVRKSLREMIQNTRIRELDFIRYPEFFEYYNRNTESIFDFYYHTNSIKNFTLFDSLYTENFLEMRHNFFMQTKSKFVTTSDILFLDTFFPIKSKSWLDNNNNYQKTFPRDTVNLPGKNFLQRYVPKRKFFINFSLQLIKNNNLSYNKWFLNDMQYFTVIMNMFLAKTEIFDFQLVSKLFLQTSFSKEYKIYKRSEKFYKHHFFNDFNLFRKILFKYSTKQQLTDLIKLLQLSLINDREQQQKQQIFNFLNKIYFLSDLFTIFEEPLTQFWYPFFTNLEIGELTTQKYVSKNHVVSVQIQKPRYYSITYLLYSFLSKHDQQFLYSQDSDFFNQTELNVKKKQLKVLNNLVSVIFTDWSMFSFINLYSSYQKLRYYDKEKINFFFHNLNLKSRNNYYVKLLTTQQYYQQQVDSFCQMQTFLALTLYQFENFSILPNYTLWKTKFYVNLFCGFVLSAFFFYYFYFFSFFCFLGFFLFFSSRFYLNKAFINNFTAYATSLFEIYYCQFSKTKSGFRFRESLKNYIKVSISRQITEEAKKIGVISRHTVLFLPDVYLFSILKNLEKQLRNFFYQTQVSPFEQIYIKSSKSSRKIKPFMGLQNGKYLNSLHIKKLNNKTKFKNFILPHEVSINSLENFSFNEIKTLKNMTLYWGISVSQDKSNRHPLFYVLQLSEDYRFFRLAKFKYVYKWLFF
jgi:hypothetical protein